MLVRSISVKSKEILQQHMPLGKVWRRRGVSEFFINLLIFMNYLSIYEKADTLLCWLVQVVILQSGRPCLIFQHKMLPKLKWH